MYGQWIDGFYRVYNSLEDTIEHALTVAMEYADVHKDKGTPIDLLLLEKGGLVPGFLVEYFLELMGYTNIQIYTVGMKNERINSGEGEKEGKRVRIYKPFSADDEARFVKGRLEGRMLLVVDEVGDSGESTDALLDYLFDEHNPQEKYGAEMAILKNGLNMDLYKKNLRDNSMGAVMDQKPRFYGASDRAQAFVRIHARGYNSKEKVRPVLLQQHPLFGNPYEKLWTVYSWEELARQADYFESRLHELTTSEQDGMARVDELRKYIREDKRIYEMMNRKLSALK